MSCPPGKVDKSRDQVRARLGENLQKDRNELPKVRQECLDITNLPTTFLLSLRLR